MNAAVSSLPPRLEMRGVRRSFGATNALRGGELSVARGVFWTAVASGARHRYWPGAFAFQNVLCHAKAPLPLRFAGAVLDARVSTIVTVPATAFLKA